MKIVIVSDVHGNLEAFRALVEAEPCDQLWVLGDLVDYGPDPRTVIRDVRDLAALVVRGNHDHAVGFGVAPRCSAAFRAMAEATQQYTMRVLGDDDVAYLRALPLAADATRGGVRFHLCHAVPSDPLFGYCRADSPAWAQEVRAVDAGVLLVGHTHEPFVRAVGDRLVVNPGSLGQPKHGTPDGSYAVWEDGEVSLRRVRYRVDTTVDKLRRLPLASDVIDDLAQVLLTGLPPAAAGPPPEVDGGDARSGPAGPDGGAQRDRPRPSRCGQ